MSVTGIVRRLDELGRIVIPKEYRKLYGIEIGEPLEIKGNDNGTLTVSKISNRTEFLSLAKSVCDMLALETGLTVAATDLSGCVCSSGINKEKAPSEPLNRTAIDKIKERRSGCLPAQGEWFSFIAYAPIVCSDVFGGLILYANRAVDDNMRLTMRLCGKLIGSMLQKF